MIRIRREKPALDYSEVVAGNLDRARHKCYEQARRSSWNPNGDNWWVWWSIENLNRKTYKWETVMQGKSHLKEGLGPEDTPSLFLPGLADHIRATQGPDTNIGFR